MTTVIDHAIAIPTRPAAVWEVLKDISNYPNWHPDSKRVQHLTTARSGRGMRWRNTTNSDKEQVFEITAWYDGLGYEYRIVDGTNYANNRGRIRLQEAPEGTVVQWTFSYEISGFLSGLRNNLSMKGSADKEIVQGLRNIYTFIKESKNEEQIDPEASKAYLKEAPNVEERAVYQPRYPSKVSSQQIPVVELDESPFKPPTQPAQPEEFITPIEIDEPPLTDEDTRPNPIVQTADVVPPIPPSDPEPDFLKAMPDPESATAAESQPETQEQETTPSPDIGSVGETETVSVEQETQPLSQQDETQNPTSTSSDATPDSSIPSSMRDTSTISVFEVFGLEKPSETEQVRIMPDLTSPVVEHPQATEPDAPNLDSFMDSTPIVPDVQPDIPERRRGLRAAMRRSGVRLRIPKSE